LDLASPLVAEWNDLAWRLAAPPQLYPGWLKAWWKAFGTEGALEIHTVRRSGRLVGVLPVVRSGALLRAAANEHTPGFAMLADSATAADHLAGSSFQGWPRRVSLVDVHPAGEAFRAFQHAAHDKGYRILIRRYRCSPYLDVTGSWKEYEAGLSKKLRKTLRSKNNRLDRLGKLSFEVIDGSGDIEKPLQEAFEVEASGWKGARDTAIVSNSRTRNFYNELTRWAAEEDMLRLFLLHLDRRPIAMCYQLRQADICYWLKIGYLPEFARYSPGMLLFQRIIRHSFENGVSRIEFCGAGERFQRDWTPTTSEWLRLEAFAPTPSGYLALMAFVYARPLAARLPFFGTRRVT
jgi:CelD/BcsL family acetyltransferase involved in cellulose biosynthesis